MWPRPISAFSSAARWPAAWAIRNACWKWSVACSGRPCSAVDLAEAGQRVHFGGLVAGGAGGGQRLLVEGVGVLVLAAGAQVPVQDGRQVQQVLRPVMFGGVPRGGEQVGQLAVQPVKRRCRVGHVRFGGACGWDLGRYSRSYG